MNTRQNDFFVAALGERDDLAQNRLRRDAARESARGRDDAIRAGVIATFLDLEKGPGVARQRPRAEDLDAALALGFGDGNSFSRTLRPLDEADEIVHAVEADDKIDFRNARDLSRTHLRIAAGDQHAGRRAPPLRAPDELARLPVRAVSDRAGVDDIAIRLVLERDDRMPAFEPRLDYRGVVLIDFAAERGDRDAHVTYLYTRRRNRMSTGDGRTGECRWRNMPRYLRRSSGMPLSRSFISSLWMPIPMGGIQPQKPGLFSSVFCG